MRYRSKHGPPWWQRLLVGVCVLSLAPVLVPASDALVFFKNGRVLKVLDTRTEGDWVYLKFSEPIQTGNKEEDEPSELGVHLSTIDRIEKARTAGDVGKDIANSSAGATHGQGLTMAEAAAAAAHASLPGGGSFEEAAEMVANGAIEIPNSAAPEHLRKTASIPHVPSKKDAASKRYSSSLKANIEPEDAIAGYVMKEAMRTSRVPQSVKNAARAYRARLKAQRERAAAQEASEPTGDSSEPGS